MKLRFEVDQADSFRQGIDRPKSIVSIDVNPADISEESRSLIAEHLDGIDVLQFFYHNGDVLRGHPIQELLYTKREPRRIVAKAANLDALIRAIKANDQYIDRIQKSFNEPVQLRLIDRPPQNEAEFHFISNQGSEPMREIKEAVSQTRRIWFECLIHELQTELNQALNSHSYVVYLLPIVGSTARARFYCEPVFAGNFGLEKIAAHSPTIVYNENTGRIAEARNLFQALDIYALSGTPVNELSILIWEQGNWVIARPEDIIEIANECTWIATDWTKADLDQKRVEFEIPLKDGRVVRGIGEFWIRRNPYGRLAIDIVTDTQGTSWAERVQTRYHMPQAAEKRIRRHPDPKVADFLVK